MNARAQMIALLSLGAHLVLCEAALAAPTITHSPSTVVLDGKRRTIEIVIRGLEGSLRVQTAVNVGDVDVIHAHHDKIEVYYRVPARRAPQRLCLLVWRGAGPVLLVRVPLLGQTKVPITTRPRARVTLSIAGRRFGPASSDDAGKLTMAVVVPPGVTRGHVEVVDDVGLTTRKPLDIARARYNPICMAVRRVAGPSARQPRFEIVAASAELDAPPPTLRAVRVGGQQVAIIARQTARGRWRALWTAPRSGRWHIEAASAHSPRRIAARSPRLEVAPATPPARRQPAARPTLRARPATPARSPSESRLQVALGVSSGVMHNLGALVSPRFGLELGGDYALPVGRIGLRLALGLSFASQRIDVAGAEDAQTTSQLWLVPTAVMLTYALRRGRFAPYVAGGVVAQVVRASSDGALSGRLVETSLSWGGRWLLGLGLQLGPGDVFVQAGYQYGRVTREDLELLAGGLLLDVGYRLRVLR